MFFDEVDPRLLGLHEGVVTDNLDPEGFGRVRVRVPGLTPDTGSNWAWPFGSPGGGASQRGLWDIPDVGAEVYVMFLGGDPSKVRYAPGHWAMSQGASQVPTPVGEAIDDDGLESAVQVKAWETSRFLLVMDDRPGRERFYIMDKTRGQDLGSSAMIEIDGANGGVIVSGTAAVLIRSAGLVDIDGIAVQIRGRPVLPISKPI